MPGRRGNRARFAAGACAAAIACAFSTVTSAQGVDVQALGRQFFNNASALQTFEGIHAGVDRAVRRPLEVIWLQSDAQDEMWRHPTLAHSVPECANPGNGAKQGCAVSVRSSWRYSFDGNSAVRPAPIVISSLSIPNAPFASGRMNFSGSGRVYIITSKDGEAGAVKAPRGVILLAAGTTVQLVDAAHPSIQIEVKAPQDEPLMLGNLADSDVTRVVALLVKQPSLVSASAANVLPTGQVALRAPAAVPATAPVQLASITPIAPVAPVEPAPEADLSPLAAILESAGEPVARPEPVTVASIDLGTVAGRFELPVRELARIEPREPVLTQDFAPLVAALETPQALPAVERIEIASVDLGALAGRLEVPRDLQRIAAEEPALAQDFTPLVAAVEAPQVLPALERIEVASIDLDALAGRLEMPRDLQRVAAEEPAFTQDFTLLASAVEVAAPLPRELAPQIVLPEAGTLASAVEISTPLPVQAAVVAPAPLAAPQPVMVASAAPQSSDLARMRAEIESEIAKERERMAQSLAGRGAARFKFGT